MPHLNVEVAIAFGLWWDRHQISMWTLPFLLSGSHSQTKKIFPRRQWEFIDTVCQVRGPGNSRTEAFTNCRSESSPNLTCALIAKDDRDKGIPSFQESDLSNPASRTMLSPLQ